MLDYRATGVDIVRADRLKRTIKRLAEATATPGVRSGVGLFGALFAHRDRLLVASVDGVGTKLKLATRLGRHDTVGADLVNHCVNDILTLGATPLFFLDYIGYSRLSDRVLIDIVRGLARACRATGCALVGGETAQLPATYPDGEYDLAGTIIGTVRSGRVIDGRRIRAGDVLVGLTANGLHTNGYSLARRVLDRHLNARVPGTRRTVGDALLRTHRCYLDVVRPVLDQLTGIAHITGGGIAGNLRRVLPPGLAAVVDRRWPVPPIFRFIAERGRVSEAEMYRVFNMGVGMVLVVRPAQARTVLRRLGEGFVCGAVVPGRFGVRLA